jgi:hypothetical protein
LLHPLSLGSDASASRDISRCKPFGSVAPTDPFILGLGDSLRFSSAISPGSVLRHSFNFCLSVLLSDLVQASVFATSVSSYCFFCVLLLLFLFQVLIGVGAWLVGVIIGVSL